MPHFNVGIKGDERTDNTITAETAGKAKYRFLLNVRDCYPDLTFAHLTCHKAAAAKPTACEIAEREAAEFNAKHPVGTMVEYWTWLREGPPSGTGKSRSAAQVICGGSVVWVEGHASCISLSHIRALPAEALR